MKDARGVLLTREDLRNPEALREAIGSLPHYSPEYTYERFTHVRLAARPYGKGVRKFLDRFFPEWDEYLDWNLLLERRAFFVSLFRAVHSSF